MRVETYEITTDLVKAVRAVKAGKPVILTLNRLPIAMTQPLRVATKDEAAVIGEMIGSGELELVQKSGAVREWKYRSARPNAQARQRPASSTKAA